MLIMEAEEIRRSFESGFIGILKETCIIKKYIPQLKI